MRPCHVCGGPVRARHSPILIVLGLALIAGAAWVGWYEIGPRLDVSAALHGYPPMHIEALDVTISNPLFAAVGQALVAAAIVLVLAFLLRSRPRCAQCGCEPDRLPPWLVRRPEPATAPRPSAAELAAHARAHPGLAGRLARAAVRSPS